MDGAGRYSSHTAPASQTCAWMIGHATAVVLTVQVPVQSSGLGITPGPERDCGGRHTNPLVHRQANWPTHPPPNEPKQPSVANIGDTAQYSEYRPAITPDTRARITSFHGTCCCALATRSSRYSARPRAFSHERHRLFQEPSRRVPDEPLFLRTLASW